MMQIMGWASRLTFVAVVLSSFAAVSLQAQTAYSVSVGEGGFNVGPCDARDRNGITTTLNSSAPVSSVVSCGPNGGAIHSSAFSNQGQVGGGLSLSESLGGQGKADSSFTTHVVFSKIGDPTSQDQIPIALNISIGGQATIAGSANGSWLTTLTLGTNDYTFSTAIDSSGVPTHGGNTLSFTSGGEAFQPGAASVSGILTTPVLSTVALNRPIAINVALSLFGFGNPGSFDTSFTLSCPVGVDVFTLPPGYTANDPDIFLVNNRCVQPSVYTWGSNNRGQLGNGTTADSNVPVRVVGPDGTASLDGVVAVSGGGSHSLALTNAGTVYAWGDNSVGQLGVGSATQSTSTPVRVSFSTSRPYAIAAGSTHSLALMDDGTVYSWGGNLNGQPGDGGSSANVFSPVQVMGPDGITPLQGIVAIAAGNQFSLALAHDNTVYAWGANLHGELGNGSTSDHVSLPAQVVGPGTVGTLSGVTAISVSSSGSHSIAMTNSSAVYAWGDDQDGELGNGATGIPSPFPVQVEGVNGAGLLTSITAVGSGGRHSLALSSSGNVYSFGYNLDNELGDGSTIEQSVPVSVLGPGGTAILGGISSVQGGGLHSLAIATTGDVYAWGAATNGQLGNGTNSSGSGVSAVQVLGLGGVGFLQNAGAVAAGGFHSIALAAAVPVASTSTITVITAPDFIFGADGSVVVAVTASSGQTAPAGDVSLSVDGGIPVSLPITVVSPLSAAATFRLANLAVGPHTLAASFAATSGLLASAATGSLTVNPANLTVTADNQQIATGQAIPTLTFTPTGLVAGDTATTAFTTPPSCSTTATANSPADTYPIKCSGGIAPNYAVTYVAGVLTVSPTSPDLTVSMNHAGTFYQGERGATYNITVTNVGGAGTIGTVGVQFALPAGLQIVTGVGTGWFCVPNLGGGDFVCERALNDAVAPGTSCPPLTLTVNVATNAPAAVNTVVTVFGGGEFNTANDMAVDPTIITAGPDLTVSMHHAGTFYQGERGATYNITVTNVGGAGTIGTVGVQFALPAGLQIVTGVGTGWFCVPNLGGGDFVCERALNDAVAPGTSCPPLTLTVNVATNAPAAVNTVVTVFGGGEFNTANDTAVDPTIITTGPDLKVVKTHVGNLTRGHQGIYNIVVSNVGGAPTTGAVTVIDFLPQGLSPVALSGSGWNCVLTTRICTRNDSLAPGSAYPAITFTVNVATYAVSPIRNIAAVVDGPDGNLLNNLSIDTAALP